MKDVQLVDAGVTGRKGGAGESPATSLVYDVPEAGAMLGLSRNGSYDAANRGEIPTIRIGKLLKVPKAAFHRMLEQPASKAS
jgi:excisionase family DNA binding protein